MSGPRKTWKEQLFGPLPPLNAAQRAMRGPVLGFLLILLACEIGLFFLAGFRSAPSFLINVGVVVMLLVNNLSMSWIREGRAGVIMRALSSFLTVALCIGMTIFFIHDYRHPAERWRSEAVSPTAAIFQQAKAAYAALSSYESSGEAICEKAGKVEKIPFTIRLERPNFYRVTWRCGNCSGVAWSDGTGNFSEVDGKITKEKDRSAALWQATDYSDMNAHTIADAFFADLGSPVGIESDLVDKRKSDEKIGDFECFVLTTGTTSYGTIDTYWIGGKDGLIHKHESVMTKNFEIPHLPEDNWANYLKSNNKPVTPAAIAALKASEARSNAQTEAELPITSTQTQTHITLNKAFSPADFAH